VLFRVLSLVASILMAWPVAARADAFVVTSPDVQDDGLAPVSGAQPACGGGANTSLPLEWSGAPASTKSFVIVLTDVDNWARAGLGTHWIAYGIPANVTSVPAGFGSQKDGHVSGVNFANQAGFRGYCPPKGEAPHHYVYTVFATDLAPDALPPGLNREALTAALKGHILIGSSVIVRYAQA